MADDVFVLQDSYGNEVINQVPTESSITKAIIAYLKKDGHYARKTFGGPAGSGWPDIIGVRSPDGRAFALEVKRPDRMNTVTLIQRKNLLDFKKAGALVGVVSSVLDARNIVGES